MIVYIENLINSKTTTTTKPLLNLKSNLAKWQDTKTIQKSVTFQKTNNKLSERETKKKIPFTVSTKNKHKLPRKKFNQGGKRPVLGKI